MDARQSLDRFVRHFLLAVQAFTRVPVKGSLASWSGSTPQMLLAGAPHLPGVGWLMGMAACVTFAVLSIGLPASPASPLAAAVACTIATVLLTGAAHETAFADFADPAREGHRATLAIVLLLGLKVSLLATLAGRSPGAVLTALLAAHTVSRFWPLVQRIPRRGLWVAGAWCAVPLALMGLAHGLSFVIGAVAASALAWWLLRGRAQPRMGDLPAGALGAVQQACEVAFYLGAAFALPAR